MCFQCNAFWLTILWTHHSNEISICREYSISHTTPIGEPESRFRYTVG